MADDREISAPFAVTEQTPVARVCTTCGGDSLVLDDDVQPPASPTEAFRLTCRETRNRTLWRWCRKVGQMVMPSQGMRVIFDRRRAIR